MCEKCGGAEYVSIEKPGGGYVVQPCSTCKPSSYKRWLKKQVTLSPTTSQSNGGDAVAISLLATTEALYTLHEARFEMSIDGLIGDAIRTAESKLKVKLPEWARSIVEPMIKTTLLQEKYILEKQDAPPIVAGPMRKRTY